MKIVAIIIVLIVLGAGLYLLFKPGTLPSGLPNTPSTQSGVNTLPKEVEVSLNTQNNSDELGTAVLQKVNGSLVVKINLKGEPEGVSQPAHIHAGACPNPGEIKYTLNPVVGGTSETVLTINGDELLGMMPLAINVHKSASEMKNYVACGDIQL